MSLASIRSNRQKLSDTIRELRLTIGLSESLRVACREQGKTQGAFYRQLLNQTRLKRAPSQSEAQEALSWLVSDDCYAMVYDRMRGLPCGADDAVSEGHLDAIEEAREMVRDLFWDRVCR